MKPILSHALLALFVCAPVFAQEGPAAVPQNPPAARPEGVSEDFPLSGENYLPGFQSRRADSAPAPAVEEPEEKPAASAPDNSKGFFRSLFDRIGSDRTFLNAILIIVIIATFVLYRLRAGRRRNM